MNCALCNDPAGDGLHHCRPLVQRYYTVQHIAFDSLVAPPKRHRSAVDDRTHVERGAGDWRIAHVTVEAQRVAVVWSCELYFYLEQWHRSGEAKQVAGAIADFEAGDR